MKRSHKIVVFTADMNDALRKGVVEIDRAMPDLEWLIVVHAPKRSVRTLMRNQWRNLRHHGWRWIPMRVTQLILGLFARPACSTPPGAPGFAFTMSALQALANLTILTVDDIHAAETLETVRVFAADLGLSLGAPFLRPSLFSLPRLGTLNLHKGKLPEYRGMPPAFWELWNDETSVGCTVHWIDAKLDTGPIVIADAVPRKAYSTVRGMQLLLDELGVELTRKAVSLVLSGTSRPLPQPAEGRTYRKPAVAQIVALNRKLSRREPPRQESLPKRVLRTMLFASAIGGYRLALRLGVRPRTTVLLYHRVSDDARDCFTVGIEQFDRHMDYVRRACDVVSIEDVVAGNLPRNARRPAVCVTFDDGYLDNYEHAVPILLKHGIPAAFFVSTGIIGTDRAFPHDCRQGMPAIPVMSWDHLRRMKAEGFIIGSHSVSHIDCAAEPEEIVRKELGQSMAELQTRLGLPDVMFAYPYGGQEHMTPARLELVKRAGYSACLSAYGGVNRRHVDRFNILRSAVHWRFSDLCFRFRCLGLL